MTTNYEANHARLKKALELVTTNDWKGPINGFVSKSTLDGLGMTDKDLYEAVVYFTGTVPTVDHVVDVKPTINGYRVRAVGYRNGPCGP